MYESQYAYIKRNPEKYAGYARANYARMKADPERWAEHRAKRKAWEDANKEHMLEAQRTKKRERKLQAIEYLGGVCMDCKQKHHAAVFEFHHRNADEKDADPSKLFLRRWETIQSELDKCDLLCANCHRMRHHKWEE